MILLLLFLQKQSLVISFYLSHAYRDPTIPTTQYGGLCHVTYTGTHDHFFRLNKVSLSLFHVECPTRRLGRPEMVRVPFLHTWYRSPSRRSDLQLSKNQSIFSENNCFPSFLVFFLISGDCGGLPEEVISLNFVSVRTIKG